MKHLVQVRHLLAGATALLAVSACVKDNTGPAGGTSSVKDVQFVGYSNPATQQTTCGNCHVLKQQSWSKTGHASAWKDLQASGHASSACYKCHTTNGQTNIANDTAGYFSASTSAKAYFQDVQCESCHGPGAAHVTTPDETQPIPYFTSYDSTKNVGCGECHSGPPHNPFYEDWSRGAHRIIEAPAISNTSGTCLQCHEGKTVAARFGAPDVYVEASSTTPMQLGCTTCHEPHGSANTHELRESITATDSTNLCIQCHKRRSVPDLTSSSGPHSPQGPTFLGYSGWRPAGFVWDSTSMTTHSNPSANKTLCATCHVATLDVNNSKGQLAWHYTGHSFYAIPCVDTAGIDSTNSCADAQRSFAACASGSCHSSAAVAQTYFESLKSEMQYLGSILWVDVNGNGKIDTGDTGLLTKVPATEFKTRSATVNNTLPFTVAEGARFNQQLITADRSNGVHNAPYFRALLVATINAVKSQYGLQAPPAEAAFLEREAQKVAASR
jgi:predicted CXXCH cytochrome family protein